MKCIKTIKNYLKRCSNECRRTQFKLGLLVGAIFLLIAIFVWSFGKNSHRILSIYLFPKFAMPLMIMYVLWSLIYIIIGFSVFSMMFNCESYKKHISQKIIFLICMSVLFSFFSYLLFFSANAPLMTFLMYLVAIVFVALAFVESRKVFTLWTMMIFMYFLWLVYNSIVCLSFLIIN
ncbi:MAG: tryptophan-rich sensory protein [Clostridia bacterium]|nr:tryptophan-rich sensory protein [Clostridia bacterium]